MALSKDVGDQSPQAKRGTSQDMSKFTKGDVRWLNDKGPNPRNKQPDPMRHLRANDGREDGSPA